MKIAYLDLNYPDFFEDYSYEPCRYGGGRIVPAPLMERFNNFVIHADKRAFNNVRSDKIVQCQVLDWEARQSIRLGKPVKDFVPDADSYDLFFHCNTNINLNLEGLKPSTQQMIWAVGWSETVHPLNINVVFFDIVHQQPILTHSNHRIFKIVIGPKVPTFEQRVKEDIIFQCTRHEKMFQSMEVAQLALKYKILTYFAGPIQHGYPLRDFVDNQTTFYMGEITQAEKIKMNKRAKVITQFQSWPTCATLAAKEAMSYGAFPIALPIGGWPAFIKQGVNGFIIQNEQDFIAAWQARDSISQRECWNTANEHSEDKMVEMLQAVFTELTGAPLT